MVLELSDGSSALARGAAALVLGLHITAGIAAILFGAAALVARKGSRLHRRAGNGFLVSMLTMSAIGTAVSPFLSPPNWSNLFGGVFSFYLVATAWMTVRREDGARRRFDVVALLVALGVVVGAATFGLRALGSPTGSLDGTPAPAYFMFAAVGAIAAAGDLRLIRRGGIRGAPRIGRHLWRMCVALFIAAASFFLGQSQVFPAAVRGSSLLLLPEVAVLGSMIYWLVRVRFTGAFTPGPAGPKAPAGPTGDPGQAPGSA